MKPSPPMAAESAARPELAGQEAVRHDQVQCPLCARHGCPSAGGSRQYAEGRYRWRKCRWCGWVFRTLQRHGRDVEELVP